MNIHMAEPLVPEPSLVKVENAIGRLKSLNPQVLIRSGKMDQSRG
jgi:hypothetical protein